MPGKKTTPFYILGILVLLNVLAWAGVWQISQNKFLEVNFFDVGQGDAILLVTPQGHQILIDGGPDSTILEKLADNFPFWDNDIDLIVLTHPDSDHMRGLIEVLNRYKVENILWTGIIRKTGDFKEWQRLIEKEGAEIKIAESGQRITWSSDPDKFIEVLYPLENLAGQEIKNTNDTSIILHLFFDDVSFLFTGDISEKVEEKLIESGSDIGSNVLKVAHHGSKYSTGEPFLKEVLPDLAVVQAGKGNPYGHPAPEVLNRLEKYDVRVLRTDQNGDIKIISDGDILKIIKEN
jgi:competence protein ComEC